MATLDLINVGKNYQQTPILQGINLPIEAGEFVAVIGPSGCGKSTLLRLVAGLDVVSEGQILINGRCVNSIPAAKRDMAMVFQNYALYPHMSAYDNMAYGLKMRKMDKKEIKKRVQETADLLQLSTLLSRKPSELSGGQRQRVAMGRAIVRAPAVFLFDEPLSNLDTKLRSEMRHEIRQLHQRLQTTSLYVTHDHTEAMTMADRIMVLNHGKIEQIGSPKILYQQPASLFVAGFTGHYPLNLMEAKMDSDKKAIVLDKHLLSLPLPADSSQLQDKTLLLAARAEHLILDTDEQKKGIPVRVIWVDDMGADKLIQVRSLCNNLQLTVRTAADQLIQEMMQIRLQLDKVNLFDKKTGLRLGGWYA